jgi:predicted secreted protein
MAGEGIGAGTEFHLHNGTALTELVGVFNVTIPESTTDDVETTHYKSAGRFREFIAGLKDRGEFTVEMNFVAGNATDILCRAADAASDTRAFKIVLPDDAGDAAWEIEGTAYAKGYSRNIPIDDRMTAVLTLRVSGDLTEAAA